MFRLVSVLGGVVALAIGLAAPAAADGNHVPVRVNPTLAVVPGGVAEVERSHKQVGMEVHDTSLQASSTYYVFWAYFNNPSACTHPHPGISLCDSGLDGHNAATGFGVVFAGTFKTTPSGRAEFEKRLRTTDTPVAPVFAPLSNPRGAELALVYGPAPNNLDHIVFSDPVTRGHDDD